MKEWEYGVDGHPRLVDTDIRFRDIELGEGVSARVNGGVLVIAAHTAAGPWISVKEGGERPDDDGEYVLVVWASGKKEVWFYCEGAWDQSAPIAFARIHNPG